jgi:hypothetical protein
VGAGLRDLHDLHLRATACVACHQNIGADVLQAGHPVLVFELDGLTHREPPHWKDKGDWFGPQAWWTGQCVALRETSWKLSQNPAADSVLAQQWQSAYWLVSRLRPGKDGKPITVAVPDNASQLTLVRQDADRLSRAASQQKWDEMQVRDTLAKAFQAAEEFKNTPNDAVAFARAQRLASALERLGASLDSGSKIQNAAALDAIKKLLVTPAAFQPSAFAEKMEQLRADWKIQG